MGYIVCWVLETKTFCDQIMRTDHYQVFCETTLENATPEEQAIAFYNNLLEETDFAENERLYTAQMCEIKNSTEPHHIEDIC